MSDLEKKPPVHEHTANMTTTTPSQSDRSDPAHGKTPAASPSSAPLAMTLPPPSPPTNAHQPPPAPHPQVTTTKSDLFWKVALYSTYPILILTYTILSHLYPDADCTTSFYGCCFKQTPYILAAQVTQLGVSTWIEYRYPDMDSQKQAVVADTLALILDGVFWGIFFGSGWRL